MGCTALIYLKPNTRKTWDSNAIEGYYLGTLQEDYQCYKVNTKHTSDGHGILQTPVHINANIHKGRWNNSSSTRPNECINTGCNINHRTQWQREVNWTRKHLQQSSKKAANAQSRRRKCHNYQQPSKTKGGNYTPKTTNHHPTTIPNPCKAKCDNNKSCTYYKPTTQNTKNSHALTNTISLTSSPKKKRKSPHHKNTPVLQQTHAPE